MNANRREHSYRDLREIVIEVMLDAGEHGMNGFDWLLGKAALELEKRDGLSLSGQHASHRRGPQLHPSDSALLIDIVWDLAREGTLTFGQNGANPNRLCFRRSPFGEHAVRCGPGDLPDRKGFMKALRVDPADISPDASVYLGEAISAFYMDCLLSSCVILSVAGESEFLRLLSVAKNSITHGRYFSRIGDGLNIGAKIAQFKEAMKQIQDLLPRPTTDELDYNLDSMQSLIRAARTEFGRPSGALPPSRDQVYLNIQLFIPFAKQAMRLRQELEEPSYSRVVRLH